MNTIFFRYLAQHGSACIEGVGKFEAAPTAIRTDISNHLLHPPGKSWMFTTMDRCGESDGLVAYIARQQNISEAAARDQYQAFCSGILSRLQSGETVVLEKTGQLQMTAGAQVEFTPHKTGGLLQPVPASRIIRKDAVHSIVVGENERTNTQMAELLHHAPAGRNSRWWIYAVLLAAAAIALIAVHFSGTSSLANRQPLTVTTP